jgi:CheY-like chemotaxis protein
MVPKRTTKGGDFPVKTQSFAHYGNYNPGHSFCFIPLKDGRLCRHNFQRMNNNSTYEEPAETRPPNASLRPALSRPQRILFVDDELSACALAKRVFSGPVFELTTTYSGFECLEQFWKRPHWFDLIVLDLSMPFMDGEETYRRLRGIRPNVPVLLSTGFFGQGQGRVERMLAAGLAGFIRKPYRPDELLARVQAVIDKAKSARVGCAASDISS